MAEIPFGEAAYKNAQANGAEEGQIPRPTESRYLPLGLVDEAPTENVSELSNWLEQNIADGVVQEVRDRRDFWPRAHETEQPFMHKVAVEGQEKEAQFVAQLLDTYCMYLRLTLARTERRV